MKLLDLGYKLTPGKTPAVTPEATRKILRTIIGKCPVCELDFESHTYVEVASVLAGDVAARDASLHALRTNDWPHLLTFRHWDAEADIVEYSAIHCSRLNAIGIVTILFTADLWSDEKLLETCRLSEAESHRLADVVGDRWLPL